MHRLKRPPWVKRPVEDTHRIQYAAWIPAAAVLAVAGVCVFLGARAYAIAQATSRGAELICIGLGAVGALVWILAFCMLLRDRRGVPFTRSKLLFPLIFMLGLAFSLLFPPLSGPDEPTHYATIYHYSNLLLGKASVFDPPARKTMGFVYYDTEYRAEDAKLMETPKLGYQNFYAPAYEALLLADASLQTVSSSNPSYPYTVLGYLPAVMGLTIGRLAGLGGPAAAFLARLFNLAVSAGLIAWSVSTSRRGGRILLIVALFPMVLHLIGTLSPDGLVIAVSFVCFREFTRLAEGERALRVSDTLPFALAAAFASMLKIYCAPLCLALLVVRPGCYQKKYACLPAVLSALAFTLTAVLIGNADAILQALSGSAASYSGNSVTVTAVLQDPLPYLGLFIKSVFLDLPMLALTMPGYSLGGFSVQLPSYVYALSYLILALLSALPEKEDGQVHLPGGLWLIPISLLALVPTYGAMLFWWTPESSERILGVQGRYFLPVLPFALAAFQSLKLRLPRMEGLIFVLCLGLDVAALPLLFVKILS